MTGKELPTKQRPKEPTCSYNVIVNWGNPMYIADPERGKVLRFIPDCVKIFKNNTTAHGMLEVGKFRYPKEYSIKYIDKRIIFRRKSNAQKWLNEQLKKKGKENPDD